MRAPRRLCRPNERSRDGQFAWPFRLVRVDDDGHGGCQGLLRRGRRLGHAGRVDARHGLYLVYRWRGLDQRANGPVGGREEIGLAAELARICGRQRRGRHRRSHQRAWRRRACPTDGHPQHQPPALDAPGGVGWHELIAADWEKAWPFYRELFGWQKAQADTSAMGPYQLFSAGGETIGGMFTKPATEPVPFWLYYFNVGDIDVAMRRVRAARGEIVHGPIEVRGGRWMAQCTDPQGAIFALAGKRSHNGIGYFEPVASRNRSIG